MKTRILLVVCLLAVGLCLIPAVGFGEIDDRLVSGKAEAWLGSKASLLDFLLLEATVQYIMLNAPNHEFIGMKYDLSGSFGEFYKFPKNISTRDKIFIFIRDIREYYTPEALSMTGWSVLELFKLQLTTLHIFIKNFATDMDNDIVALVQTRGEVPLAYFYQGEYYLWGE